MMRVPLYDGPQVLPSGAPTQLEPDVSAAQLAAGVGRPEEALGQSLQSAGQATTNVAIDMQDMANQVQVNAATNAARQAQLALTFDPNTGYKNLKGNAALQRPDGQALPDEYGQKFQDQLSNISAGLGNDAQKRAFGLQSNDMMTQFKGDVENHMLGEFRSYAISTQDGAIKIGSDTAKLNWDNPDKIAPAVASVQAAVYQSGQINGEAANETTAKMRTATSAIHSSVIGEALQNNNPEYALAYLNQNKGQMTADDLLRARGLVNKDMYARVADGTATNVVQGLRTSLQPSNIDRVTNITMGTESGGKDFNADGTPVVSPKGAKYSMQVMPATAANPGYGIPPAESDTPAAYNRVGMQLLNTMIQKYGGNMQMAWAAYNGGAGNVDAAIDAAASTGDAGGDWLSLMPDETQKYVATNMAKLNAPSGGAPARPTLQNVHDGIRASIAQQFGATPPMGVLNAALQAGTKQWEDLNKNIDAQGDAAVRAAQQTLIQNGGDFTKLPADQVAAVTQYAPGKMDDLSLFAKHIAKGENITNPTAFAQAVTHPQEMANMSDSDFVQFMTTNFSTSDADRLSKLRAGYVNGTADNSPKNIDNEAFNTAFNFKLNNLGLSVPKASDSVDVKAEYGARQQFARNVVYDEQMQAGHKFAPADITKSLDNLFAKNIAFKNTWLGVSTGDSTAPLMATTASGIPADTATALRASFAKRGNPNPTDSDLLGAYLKWKSSNGN